MRGSIKRMALALSLSGLMMWPQVYNGQAATRNRTGNVTLNVWYHAYGEAGTHQAVQRYAREYEQSHPGVHINITWGVGQGAYPQKPQPALLSKKGPHGYQNNDPALTPIKTHQDYPPDRLY